MTMTESSLKEERDGSGIQEMKTDINAHRTSLFISYINLTTTQSITSRTPPLLPDVLIDPNASRRTTEEQVGRKEEG